MNLTETRLASTNHQSVIADVKKLFADWNEGRQTLRLDSECNILPFEEGEDGLIQVGQSPSGYRIDIVPIRDRELEKPEYNEEGELTKEAVTEQVYELHLPEWFDFTAKEELTVSRRQFFLGITFFEHNGSPLKQQIEALIASLPEPSKTIVETEYDQASSFDRLNPSVLAIAEALEISEQVMDEFFDYCLNENW